MKFHKASANKHYSQDAYDCFSKCVDCGAEIVSSWDEGDEDRGGSWSRWGVANKVVFDQPKKVSERVTIHSVTTYNTNCTPA